MARLSDFQNYPSRGRNLAAEALVDRNAAAIRNVRRFSETHIGMKEGAAESQPYGRDAAVTAFHRRQGLHAALDKTCCDINMTEDQAAPIHQLLDRHLDAEESGANDEPPEADDDAEENEEPEHVRISSKDIHRALDVLIDASERRKKKTRRTSHDAGFICDSDYIAKYLNPNKLCVEVSNKLRPLVLAAQENNATRGYWAGLFEFLYSQPEGTRIRDCRRATLSTLISKTLAAA